MKEPDGEDPRSIYPPNIGIHAGSLIKTQESRNGEYIMQLQLEKQQTLSMQHQQQQLQSDSYQHQSHRRSQTWVYRTQHCFLTPGVGSHLAFPRKLKRQSGMDNIAERPTRGGTTHLQASVEIGIDTGTHSGTRISCTRPALATCTHTYLHTNVCTLQLRTFLVSAYMRCITTCVPAVSTAWQYAAKVQE